LTNGVTSTRSGSRPSALRSVDPPVSREIVWAVSGTPAGWVIERTSATPGTVRSASVSRSTAARRSSSTSEASDETTRKMGASSPAG